MRGLAGPMMIVKNGAFVEERGFRRIQIFRRGVLGERPAAKGDDPADGIVDRKHDPVPETIIGDRNLLAMDQKPRLDHRLHRNSLGGERIAQGVFFRQGVAQAETGSAVSASRPRAGEIGAGRASLAGQRAAREK